MLTLVNTIWRTIKSQVPSTQTNAKEALYLNPAVDNKVNPQIFGLVQAGIRSLRGVNSPKIILQF